MVMANKKKAKNAPSNLEPDLIDEDAKKLRDHILKCSGVSPKSTAVTKALAALQASNGKTDPQVLSPPSFKRSALRILMRTLFLDLPLVTVFALLLAFLVLDLVVHDRYLGPQLKLMEFTPERKAREVTYYNRVCNAKDVSTTDAEDLILPSNVTADEALEHMLTHGISIYPDILQPTTADALREFIVDRNAKEEGFWVIENNHRFSFGVRVNQDPIVAKALREIGTHTVLRQALDKIAGENPAIIEFTAITSTYGAEDQYWHQDTLPMGSSFKHARTFIPSFSLFIPLQDTTADMGATQVCPGSHICDETDTHCRYGGGVVVSGKQDRWRKGYGALVNQHLHHRGTAHVHKDGPDRVLFILTFAPRPRMGEGEVETRLLSMGGSYSLHWSQWGHTIDDFADAPSAMSQPWKTLRSLGIYKPSNSDWGWDMITVASMRISNDDNGYHRHDLEQFLTKGGFPFLPQELQGQVSDDEGWHEFLLDTVHRCEEFLVIVNAVAVGAYLITMALVDFILWFRRKGRGSFLLRSLRRLIITHIVAALCAGLGIYYMSTTPWAKNIENGKLYQLHQLPVSHDIPPATLPSLPDALVGTRYNSKYLDSYSLIVEATHLGNKELRTMAMQNSDGYSSLSASMKQQLSSDMVQWLRQNGGRLLTQNEMGNWYELSEQAGPRWCHKELMKQANPMIGRILTEIDYLLSETKFGVFRDMSLHRRHVPALLQILEDKIIVPPKYLRLKAEALHTSHLPFRRVYALPALPSYRGMEGRAARSPTLTPKAPIEEPYLGAWIKEGEYVDGKYNGEFNEWYKGKVILASADAATYDIVYEDGEVDYGLCRQCVRPYHRLELDEFVAMRKQNEFFGGRIVKVHPNESYDIETYVIGLQTNVSTVDIRRFDYLMEEGMTVEAKFQGEGDIWYPGVITKVNDDGSYDVEYFDGDRELEVEPEHIRPAVP